MAREGQWEVPFDIPRLPWQKKDFHFWLMSQRSQMGEWGRNGREVGVGFKWYTRSGVDNYRLNKATAQMKRALKSAGIVAYEAWPYNLEQRIYYMRDGEPYGILSLREE